MEGYIKALGELGFPRDNAKVYLSKKENWTDEEFEQLHAEIKNRMSLFDKEVGSLNSDYATFDQAVEIAQKLCPNLAKPVAQIYVKKYDMDDNKQLELKELRGFLLLISNQFNYLLIRNRILEHFDEMDKDDSGFLEYSELIDFIEKRCGSDDALLVKASIETYDENKDGKISKEEFDKMWKKMF